jgi:hypothetical protein
MSLGVDYVTGPPVTALQAAGVTFVCRYLSYVNNLTQIKLLTPMEAQSLGQAGIAIVSNYEWYGDRALEGSPSGILDAQIASAQHMACGGPGDRPIYFSVDFDASAAQMTSIIDYFQGVSSIIGLARTGAYGSYATIKALFDAGAITWGWQTYAWSDGAWDSRAQIQQYENGVTLAGADVDYNRSTVVDIGQWMPGGFMAIPTGWTDNNSTLTAPNGIKVVLGFRDYILSHPWDAGNIPLETEYHASPVLLHNAGIGDGQRQVFRDGMLWYTAAKGVVWEPYDGLELDACYKLITSLQAQATTPVRPDTTALIAAINSIADGVAKEVAREVTLALIEVKKL